MWHYNITKVLFCVFEKEKGFSKENCKKVTEVRGEERNSWNSIGSFLLS